MTHSRLTIVTHDGVMMSLGYVVSPNASMMCFSGVITAWTVGAAPPTEEEVLRGFVPPTETCELNMGMLEMPMVNCKISVA